MHGVACSFIFREKIEVIRNQITVYTRSFLFSTIVTDACFSTEEYKNYNLIL